MKSSRRAADYLFERSEFNPLRHSEASLTSLSLGFALRLGNTGYSRGIFWFVPSLLAGPISIGYCPAEEKNERLY